jgi:MSHA pilin protein MshA
MNRTSGFTLIELIVVIVIIGILSAIAAPKFMNLQSEARLSAIQGLVASLKSSVNMSYSEAVIQGLDKLPKGHFICVNGEKTADGSSCSNAREKVVLSYGRPSADLESGILNSLNINLSSDLSVESDWYAKVRDTSTPASIYIWPKGTIEPYETADGVFGCAIYYTEAYTSGDVIYNPTITIFDYDC